MYKFHILESTSQAPWGCSKYVCCFIFLGIVLSMNMVLMPIFWVFLQTTIRNSWKFNQSYPSGQQ